MEMEEGKREGEGERRKQACRQALLSGWIDLVVCSMFAKEKKGEGRREIKQFTRSHAYLLARLNLESKSSQDGRGGEERRGE